MCLGNGCGCVKLNPGGVGVGECVDGPGEACYNLSLWACMGVGKDEGGHEAELESWPCSAWAEQRLNDTGPVVQGPRDECLIRAEVVEPVSRGGLESAAWWPGVIFGLEFRGWDPLQLQRLPTG